MEDRPTVIYVAGSVQQAYMLKNLLAEQGIEAIVTNETLEKGSGVDYVGWATLARVVVDEADAPLARAIALEHDRQGAEMAQEQQPSDDALVQAEAVPESWPRCPECGAPRVTRCPICKTTGTEFPLADDQYVWGMGLDELPDGKHSCSCGGHTCGPQAPADQEEEPAGSSAEPPDDEHSPEHLVLMCPTCSEPFVPEFPRRCTWCDHEFDEGFEPEEIVQPLPQADSRVVAIVVGLLILAAVIVAYFWFVV